MDKVKVRVLRPLGDWQPGDVVAMDAEKAAFHSETRNGKPPAVELMKKAAPRSEDKKTSGDDAASED